MKWQIGLALALLGTAGVAHAQQKFTEKSGNWTISGSGGDCVMAMGSGTAMLMVASPASGGENMGGLVVANSALTVAEGPTTLEYSGPPGFAGQRSAFGNPEFSGYWTGFATGEDVASFPDGWQMTARHQGTVVVNITVTGFRAARTVLDRCARTTKPASR